MVICWAWRSHSNSMYVLPLLGVTKPGLCCTVEREEQKCPLHGLLCRHVTTDYDRFVPSPHNTEVMVIMSTKI